MLLSEAASHTVDVRRRCSFFVLVRTNETDDLFHSATSDHLYEMTKGRRETNNRYWIAIKVTTFVYFYFALFFKSFAYLF